MVCLVYTAFCFVRAYVAKIHINQQIIWNQRWMALKRAALPLLIQPVIIGGICAGAFTPTEAAGLSFLLCFVTRRRLGFEDIVPIGRCNQIKISSAG